MMSLGSVMMSEADEGSSSQCVRGILVTSDDLGAWDDVRVPGVLMVAVKMTSPHNFHVVFLSLCAVCAYVYVCVGHVWGMCELG